VKDALLDRFMPAYDVSDHHQIDVEAPAAVTLAAAKQVRFEDSRIVRAIFRARELILRSTPDTETRPAGLLELTKSMGWGVLADEPSEIVMGGVTKPWEANPVFRAVPPDQFASFAEPGYVKIVWMLRADPAGDAASRFVTETRAVATDPASRTKFRIYWGFLSPGIHLIRRAMLPLVKAAAERRAPLAGDDIIGTPRADLTYAITIDAPPRDVWPWLVQMGCQRAGWYSWDVLDNAGARSADRIIPELQHIAVGDVLPYKPTGSEGFKVLRVEPERALILGSTTPTFEGTWAFVLEPIGETQTRLVTRYRASFEPSTRMSATLLWARALHAVMESKQLKTIKHHAEHAHN
jgi:hypothetical protein